MTQSFSLGELSLSTEIELSGLDSGIKEAEGKAADGGTRIGQALAGAIKVGVLAGAAVVTAAVVGIGAAAFDVAADTDAATRNIQAQLGTTAEEAERLGDVALQVFGDNWYGSVEEAGQVVGLLRQQLGDMADEDLRRLAGGVAAIGDTFDAEAPAVIDAVKAITTNFPGTTEAQALDMITAGFQRGLNANGDYLESITEYGPQFQALGSSADEFFSVLETGASSGVMGTDKIADMFKESRLLIGEETDASREALTSIGIDADAFYQKLRDGSLSGIDATNMVISALRGIEDPVLVQTAGVALLGTQFEDLGPAVALGVNSAATSLADMAGATDGLNARYTSLGDVWSSINRQFLVAIEPVGAKLLSIANDVMPHVQSGFAWLGEQLPDMIDGAVVAIDQVIATGQAWASNIQTIVGFVESNLNPILAALGAALVALVPIILATVIPAFIAWATAAGTAAAATIAALAPVVLPIVAIGAAVGLLVAAWENDWGGMRTTLTEVWEGTLRPIFDQLKGWFDRTLPQAISYLQGVWNSVLLPAFRTVASFVTGTLIPAITTAADTFRRLSDAANTVGTAVGERLRGPIQSAADLIKGALASAPEAARSALQSLATWLNNIKDAASGVVRWVNDAVRAIEDAARAVIPDWLEGQSPPPMAKWFTDIGASAEYAAKALPDFGGSLGGLGGLDVATPATVTGGVTLNGGITIQQLPGEDGEALADRVIRTIEDRTGRRL